MKSLNDNPLIHISPEIFTPEILEFLAAEGFEQSKNDSYCDKEMFKEQYEESCLYKNHSEKSNFHIGIYIFSYGIGADIDYDCGGNMTYGFWEFKNNSFEESYDSMVDYVNGYKF